MVIGNVQESVGNVKFSEELMFLSKQVSVLQKAMTTLEELVSDINFQFDILSDFLQLSRSTERLTKMEKHNESLVTIVVELQTQLEEAEHLEHDAQRRVR